MKYTPNTIFRAVTAFVVAFGGAAATAAQGGDLAAMDIGGWLTAIGSGLTAAGALFVRPSKGGDPVEAVTTSLSDALVKADEARNHIGSVIDEAQGKVSDFVRTTTAAIGQVQQTIGGVGAAGVAETLGLSDDAEAIINGVIRRAQK